MVLQNKRILVTGGTRGIGRAVVEASLANGARVAVNGRSLNSVDMAIEQIGPIGHLVRAVGNVGTAEGCQQTVAAAVDGLGGLDILINSAGVDRGGPIEDCGEEIWDEVVDVNLKGTFFCIRFAVPELKKNRGSVVNLASDAGLIGVPNGSVYCASKGGVVLLTRALAVELAPAIRVNCVCPGYVDTDMSHVNPDGTPVTSDDLKEMHSYAPMGRIASAQEVADLIVYLASEKASFITGAAMPIDGGSTAGH